MIWADIHGDIGWQAVGIAPVRKNFSGLVPVPGDGRFEWEGYLPILEKPNALNPKQGYFATANQNVTPKDYTNWDAIGFSWADPFRGDRIEEVLSEKKIFDIEDMRLLQVDEVSVPAKIITKFNHEMKLSGKYAEVLDLLKDWDHKLTSNSIPASIYNEWENQIKVLAKELFIPEIVKDYISNIQLKKIIDWLENPETRFKENPIQERIAFLEKSFTRAIDSLTKKVGADPTKWHYGQTLLKHVTIKHPLGESSNSETREFLNVGPLPRGGNAYTVGSTGSDYEQSSGASFRIIVPVGDWDKTIGTNSPGQSGNPKSNFYKNLFKPWAENTYFPVYFSKDLILLNTVEKVFLIPKSE
jgi:penicillin amidase